jgi:hypothetical protein
VRKATSTANALYGRGYVDQNPEKAESTVLEESVTVTFEAQEDNGIIPAYFTKNGTGGYTYTGKMVVAKVGASKKYAVACFGVDTGNGRPFNFLMIQTN